MIDIFGNGFVEAIKLLFQRKLSFFSFLFLNLFYLFIAIIIEFILKDFYYYFYFEGILETLLLKILGNDILKEIEKLRS